MNTKEYKNTIKETIKAKEVEQKFYKNQRKTVRLVGERKVSPSDAAYKVLCGKADLTEMYIAYYCIKHRIQMDDENKQKVLDILLPKNESADYRWNYAKTYYNKWYAELEKIFENEKKDAE